MLLLIARPHGSSFSSKNRGKERGMNANWWALTSLVVQRQDRMITAVLPGLQVELVDV